MTEEPNEEEFISDEELMLRRGPEARRQERQRYKALLDVAPQSKAEATQQMQLVLVYEARRFYHQMEQDREAALEPPGFLQDRYDALLEAVRRLESGGLQALTETDWRQVPRFLRVKVEPWSRSRPESVSSRPDDSPRRTRGDGPAAADPSRTDHEQTTASSNTQRGSEQAMESVGKKTVQGNLTGDPRQVRTKAGQELVVMTVAENGRRFNEDSRAWEDTEAKFYDVAVDRAQLRENVLASLRKGDRVTVTGDYRVGAYATSTGKPGLNHRIWAEDVAASMQFNPVSVLPRERSQDGAALAQGPEQSAGRAVDSGVRPEEVTPEAFAAWAAQQPPVVPQPQGATGVSR